MKVLLILTFALLLLGVNSNENDLEAQEERANRLVDEFMIKLDDEKFIVSEANWKFATNITDETLEGKSKAELDYAKFVKENGLKLLKYNFKNFKDQDLKRKMKKLTNLGAALLPEEKFKLLDKVTTDMQSNFAKAKVAAFKDKSTFLALDPDLTEIFVKSRDPEELKYYWINWYDTAGTASKENFFKYAELKNEAARLNNFPSAAESWLDEYDDETFENQVEEILNQLTPLYKQLHGYVRYKLHEKYGDIVDLKKPIPMHLLGNVWAQTWDEIADIIVPYPSKPILDVTDEMVAQGYNPVKMFEMGDAFFQSLNMTKLPASFWEKSVLEKPTDGRELVCHASAWDFSKNSDVRIKQCTRVNMDHYFTVHHELGHIQYYLQYEHQPSVYKEGANPGFHEAVGDVLSLSVSTPKHLRKIGLLKNFEYDDEAKLNQFVRIGLQKFAFLPFAFVMDKFRWEVFRGNIKPEEANCKFWELREKWNGVEPPVFRSNEDFDAPAKYHISADVEYLRYFVSYITQFQFYKAVCEKAGEFVPGNPEKTLNECDFYQSAEAGNLFKSMLQMGSSKPWPDAMEVITGQRNMDASAILEYFKPLQEWLEAKNKELDVHIGWEKSDKYSCVI